MVADMKPILLLIFLLVLLRLSLAGPALAQPPGYTDVGASNAPYTEFEYWGDKKYAFSVSLEQLRKAPAWSAAQDTPPLSPRKATAAAWSDLRSFLPSTAGWGVERIELCPLRQGQYWVYRVVFSPDYSTYDGPLLDIGVTVLMDGTAIKPTITPR